VGVRPIRAEIDASLAAGVRVAELAPLDDLGEALEVLLQVPLGVAELDQYRKTSSSGACTSMLSCTR
jgi:hypothetical protein